MRINQIDGNFTSPPLQELDVSAAASWARDKASALANRAQANWQNPDRTSDWGGRASPDPVPSKVGSDLVSGLKSMAMAGSGRAAKAQGKKQTRAVVKSMYQGYHKWSAQRSLEFTVANVHKYLKELGFKQPDLMSEAITPTIPDSADQPAGSDTNASDDTQPTISRLQVLNIMAHSLQQALRNNRIPKPLVKLYQAGVDDASK